jgi:hypothetical protein
MLPENVHTYLVYHGIFKMTNGSIIIDEPLATKVIRALMNHGLRLDICIDYWKQHEHKSKSIAQLRQLAEQMT